MPKRPIAPLVSGPVRLRLLEEADLPMTRAWRNQDHIRQWYFHSDRITAEQHHGWWERYRDRDDDFVFVIEETQSLKRPVGQVAVYNIDWHARRAEFGRLMIGDTDAQGRGLAGLATSRIVEAAFREWGLAELHLEVRPTNLPAVAIYRRCGFREIERDADRLKMQKTIP